MIVDTTPVARLDWESPGKRLYHVPFTLDGTWGRVRLPLCVWCAARPGKTVAAIGGTYGNEYEGPVGLKRLIRDLDASALAAGRLIVIAGPLERLLPPDCDRQRFVSSADLETWMTAPASGISEPLVPLGSFVKRGQPVAAIHDFERIDEPPVEIRANLDGYLLVRRFKAPTTQGDVVAVVAQEIV